MWTKNALSVEVIHWASRFGEDSSRFVGHTAVIPETAFEEVSRILLAARVCTDQRLFLVLPHVARRAIFTCMCVFSDMIRGGNDISQE